MRKKARSNNTLQGKESKIRVQPSFPAWVSSGKYLRPTFIFTRKTLKVPTLSGSYWNRTTMQSLINQGISTVIFSACNQISLPTIASSQCYPKWEWQIWTTQCCKPSLSSSLPSAGNCNPELGTNPPHGCTESQLSKGRSAAFRHYEIPHSEEKSYPVSVLNTKP